MLGIAIQKGIAQKTPAVARPQHISNIDPPLGPIFSGTFFFIKLCEMNFSSIPQFFQDCFLVMILVWMFVEGFMRGAQ